MKRRDLLKVLGLSPFVAKKVIEKRPEEKPVERVLQRRVNVMSQTACTVTWGPMHDESDYPYMIETYQVKRQK